MNEEFPPPNRALGWYRFFLWLMPTCIAITTLFGLDWLARVMKLHDDHVQSLWWVMTLAATIGIGIIEPKFDRRWDGQTERVGLTKVVRFVLLQFLIVPLLGFVVGYGFCLVTRR